MSLKPGTATMSIQVIRQSTSRPTEVAVKADVIAAIQYRRYHKFLSMSDQVYDEGICFFNSAGECIANYPKQHSANCTAKHQATKEMVQAHGACPQESARHIG